MVSKQPKRKSRPGVDEYGRTRLHYAAAEGNARLCEDLLKTGEDVNAQDDRGWTPLHFAAQAVSAPVTQLLVTAGANTELRDSFGNTPLWRAVFDYRGDGGVIEILRSAGADASAENGSGISPVVLARRIGNYDVRKFFEDVP